MAKQLLRGFAIAVAVLVAATSALGLQGPDNASDGAGTYPSAAESTPPASASQWSQTPDPGGDSALVSAPHVGTQQEEEPLIEVPDLPDLPPVPNVPLPEELDPVMDIMAPLLAEAIGRPCASTGATLALVLLIVPAVAPDLLELPVEIPVNVLATDDLIGLGLLLLRNVMTAHSIACGYVPPVEERIMCDPDRQLLSLIPEDVADALDLLGEPSDLAPAPAGGAVATVGAVESLGGQERTGMEALFEALDCEYLDPLGRPTGDGGGDASPEAAAVPEGTGISPDEAAAIPQGAPLVGPGPSAGAASSPAGGAAPVPQAAAAESVMDSGGVATAAGGRSGPWSWIFLAIVLALLASTYMRRRGDAGGAA